MKTPGAYIGEKDSFLNSKVPVFIGYTKWNYAYYRFSIPF